MAQDDTKISIWTDGDSSVGISGNNATVVFENEPLLQEKGEEAEEYRELVRSELKKAFGVIFDAGPRHVHVMFEAELVSEGLQQ